jgi:thiol-disulfide isomerase/thioredoxin
MRKFSIALAVLISMQSFAKIAPSFTGDLLSGGRTSLSKHLKEAKDNNKLILLSFWASWCAPCMQELKEITQKMKEDKNLPLQVLTVNVDTSETASDVKPTLKLYKFDVPVITDPKHEIFGKYQPAKSLPFSVLIGANGEIQETFSGYNEEMFNKIKEHTAQLKGTTHAN